MTRFASVLADAAAAGRAVGAFTCYDMLGFEAVVRAAEARAAPVIVLVGPGSVAAAGRRAPARRVPAPPPRRRVCRCWCSSTTRPTAS